MEFKVRFQTMVRLAHYVAFCRDYRPGIKRLDEVRQLTGVTYLNPALVSNYAEGLAEGEHYLTLTEDQARKAGHFDDQGLVKVIVPAEALNRFIKVDYRIKRDPTTGEVIEVRARHKVDDEALYNAWAEAGFPLEWDPAQDNQES